MKIAILSNVTVEVLAGMLKKEHSVWLAPGFGAWMETALEVPDELRKFGPDVVYILLDRHFDGARTWRESDVAAAVASLKTVFSKVPVVVPDLAALAADFGEEFYDPKMWKLGAMPFSMKGLRELAKLFSFKKVLCLDLDNTLWKGVIGEDGTKGVAPDVDFQRRVMAVKERGVVLAVLSRNNPGDVEPMWNDPRMVLGKDDFAAIAVNWEDKAANIARIAAELNLGLESFVFVDDNPIERAQMRAMRPEVCTAAFPADLGVYFPGWKMTAEDVAKTAQYKAEASRREFAVGLSVAEYIKGLEIRVEIHPVREEEIPRVAQLSQKTNQFNVCGNRYSEDDIRRFAVDGAHLVVTLHAGDRFGDQGLVAFVLVRCPSLGAGEKKPATATILDWVMSCRVMNRRIEFTMEEEVERLLRTRGVERVEASWRRLSKNAPVEDLFEKFGYALESCSEGEKKYVKVF